MNKAEKEVAKKTLEDEKQMLSDIKKVYEDARKEVRSNIETLASRSDLQNAQSIVYQMKYQVAIDKQISGILDKLNSKQYSTVESYLKDCYNNGYIGNMYALQSKGIPLAVPVNQKQVIKAINNNSKLSVPLYTRLGEDIGKMKKDVKQYVSRNVIQGKSWSEIADGLANGMNTPFDRAYNLTTRIARTEGHKIQEQATFDSMLEAKDAGADVVKQWDATLDDRTREEHAEADGQIREIDEPFDVGGEQIMMPGEGSAENCINCRCHVLTRARWALDESELAELQDRASYFGLDKTKDFNDYMTKYLNLPEGANEVNVSTIKQNSLAGVTRGEPMTFADADSGNVNPHYNEGGGYTINCQSCVPTFEARLRGYDVEVLPNTKGSALEDLARHTNQIWVDPATGKHPEYIKNDALTTPKKYLQFISDTVQQDERYSIEFAWKGRSRSGHIVNLDRTPEGLLRIKDNQRGLGERSEWIGDSQVLAYLGKMKYTTSVYGNKFPTVPKMLRIDNMQFDEDVAKKIMKGFGK